MSSHADAHDIQKEIRKYWIIFGALAALTVVTVAISYLHLPIYAAVALAMVVASIKGGLVACYFMHLISEKIFIYVLLAVSFVIILGLFTLPIQMMDVIRGTVIVP